MKPQASLTPDEIAFVKEMVRGSKRRSPGTRIAIISLAVAVIGLLFSGGTWLATRFAASSAHKATQLQEATSLLSVEPRLEVVQAVFHPLGNPPYPPHILLYNSDRVDALAVTVEMNIWEGEIHPNGVPVLASMRLPIPQWLVGDIAPSKTHVILVSTPPTQPIADLPEEIRKSRHRFIELIIRYLRAADRKSYEQRSYYFVGTTGTWVREDDPQSDTEFNRRIKQFIGKGEPWIPPFLPPSVFSPAHFTSQ
jgi:hypothetical protein